jgi:hypothetical protein
MTRNHKITNTVGLRYTNNPDQLTLKSWKTHGTTSLEGKGVCGLEPEGDAVLPLALFVWNEPFRLRCEWIEFGTLESEPCWEVRPLTSSPKKPASFF